MRPWGQTSLGPQRLTKPSLGKTQGGGGVGSWTDPGGGPKAAAPARTERGPCSRFASPATPSRRFRARRDPRFTGAGTDVSADAHAAFRPATAAYTPLCSTSSGPATPERDTSSSDRNAWALSAFPSRALGANSPREARPHPCAFSVHVLARRASRGLRQTAHRIVCIVACGVRLGVSANDPTECTRALVHGSPRR